MAAELPGRLWGVGGTMFAVATTVTTFRPCQDCGTPTNRRHKTNYRPVCAECSLARAVSAARQMKAKSGPAWDAWCASVGRLVSGEG